MKKMLLCTAALCLLLLTACTSKTEEATPEVEAPVVVAPVEEEPVVEEETPVEMPPVEESVEVAMEAVTLFLPNDNVDGFDQEVVELDSVDEHLIVAALVEAGALPEGCAVLSMTVDGDHMDLDMSQEYGTAVATTGTAGEIMFIGALVNTLTTAFDVTTITLTVEGNVLETGHTVYDFPLEFVEDNQ